MFDYLPHELEPAAKVQRIVSIKVRALGIAKAIRVHSRRNGDLQG